MREWRESSNDLSFAQLAYHDLRVDLSEGSYVRAGRLERALSDAPRAGHRARRGGAHDRAHAGGRLARGAHRAGAGPDRRHATGVPRVDRAMGRAPAERSGPGDARTRQSRCSTSRSPVTTDCRPRAPCASPRLGTVRYVGQGLSPQYFLVSGPGFFGGEATFAVVYAPLRAAQRAAGRAGRVNELLVRLAPGLDVAAGERRSARCPGRRRCLASARPSRAARRSAPTASCTTTPAATSGS